MEQLSFRLLPGQFVKEEIEKIVKKKNISAGVLLSMVGSVDVAVLRMAGSTPEQQNVKTWNVPLEIVSVTGTVAVGGCHIHASFSDAQGAVIGGHLKDGCRVLTTAEVVIGIVKDVGYSRTHDSTTGFKELVIYDL